MCGAEFCSMRIDQDARDAEGEMEPIDDETDLDDSDAADVNLPRLGLTTRAACLTCPTSPGSATPTDTIRPRRTRPTTERQRYPVSPRFGPISPSIVHFRKPR